MASEGLVRPDAVARAGGRGSHVAIASLFDHCIAAAASSSLWRLQRRSVEVLHCARLLALGSACGTCDASHTPMLHFQMPCKPLCQLCHRHVRHVQRLPEHAANALLQRLVQQQALGGAPQLELWGSCVTVVDLSGVPGVSAEHLAYLSEFR